MKQKKITAIYFGILFTLSLGCSNKLSTKALPMEKAQETALYAKKGTEHKVYFRAFYRSEYRELKDLRLQSIKYEISRITPFLFGPLTYRSLGGVQKGESISPLIDEAYLQNGRVMIPYDYSGIWLIQTNDSKTIELPLPLSLSDLQKSNWQSCTEISNEDHSTWGFLWYFWEPTRPGCKNSVGNEYQIVSVQIADETPQTNNSFPEYQRMIRMVNGVPTIEMTFAFGYVEDKLTPKPFSDSDYGMREFQKFYRQVKNQLSSMGFQETSLRQGDFTSGSTIIGALFTGMKNGTLVKISIVAAAGVDQMDLFANSFAQKHESFFGWFGHSRVGAGFDANRLKEKLLYQPDKYKITPDYQLVYWAGCNSYSYYTLPFFDMKLALDPANDPKGTRNLDIISNTLPSLFAFNAANADIALQAILNWNQPTSYQTIVDRIENHAASWNYDVMVNVLGDEDNL